MASGGDRADRAVLYDAADNEAAVNRAAVNEAAGNEEAVMRVSYADRGDRVGELARRRVGDRGRNGVRDGSRESDEIRTGTRAAGTHADESVDVRVWHPSEPGFRRTRVRNDDSIVLELALGNVSLILPGDIGPAVERVLAADQASPSQLLVARASPQFPTPASRPPAGTLARPPAPRTPAFPATASPAPSSPLSSPAHGRVTTVRTAMQASMPDEHLRVSGPLRVLKVPHHGSKSSSTAPFLDALQPRLAIVSAGRGNRYGHPAPAALARYAARGTEVFRTDQDGAIQLDTDGYSLTVRTCSGRRLSLRADGSD
jgi:hypothetical protein